VRRERPQSTDGARAVCGRKMRGSPSVLNKSPERRTWFGRTRRGDRDAASWWTRSRRPREIFIARGLRGDSRLRGRAAPDRARQTISQLHRGADAALNSRPARRLRGTSSGYGESPRPDRARGIHHRETRGWPGRRAPL
jgi:hypothetical protein